MNYNEFAQKIKTKYPQYADMDDLELTQKMIAKYPEYKEQVVFDKVEKPQQTEYERIVNDNTLTKEQKAQAINDYFKKEQRNIQKERWGTHAKNFGGAGLEIASAAIPIGGGAKLATKLLPKAAPVVKNLASNVISGGVTGGVSGFGRGMREGENPLQTSLQDTALGAGLTASLPVVGKVAQGAVRVLPASGNVVAQSIARLKPETLKRAVQPDSKSLDITADEAQNYLANITERVRTGYDDLLSKRGEAISNAEENLRLLEDRINAEDLINDVGDVFGKNQGERINTVRDLTGNLENDLLDLIARGTDETGTIAPIDLQRIKQQVGEMTNWADTTRPKIQNKTLEQIYGKFNKRLIDISPELAMANKEYAKIKNFQNNEGLKRVLRPGDNIDSASTALKNYNTTVTKGNTSRNIQDLENALVNEGQAPFISDIDDINAAMDLNNARTTGDSWLANLATQLTRPALKGVRAFNRYASNSPFMQAVANTMPQFRGLGSMVNQEIVPLINLGRD